MFTAVIRAVQRKGFRQLAFVLKSNLLSHAQDPLRSVEKYGKKIGHLPAWKSREHFVSSLSKEKENNFPDLIF